MSVLQLAINLTNQQLRVVDHQLAPIHNLSKQLVLGPLLEQFHLASFLSFSYLFLHPPLQFSILFTFYCAIRWLLPDERTSDCYQTPAEHDGYGRRIGLDLLGVGLVSAIRRHENGRTSWTEPRGAAQTEQGLKGKTPAKRHWCDGDRVKAALGRNFLLEFL
ncbi:RNA polymerase beta'' subunit [Striga asiatica]|uniref:RNA polymerase beta'' subunit n=1 Tax=Striga asiatica TaxID=4170 RepID=A0A5A7P5W7_STRAF|nr:RNA polymerase beta'' subunit [Striga asiatica]